MVTSRSLLFSLVFCLVFSGVSAQSKSAKSVLAAESARFSAMTRGDTLALQTMLADDLVYVHSNALTENKSQHLRAIASRKLVYQNMERQDARVRFYGKTALVNGNLKVSGILNGNAFDVKLLYVAVYRKKRTSWKLVYWQSTKVP